MEQLFVNVSGGGEYGFFNAGSIMSWVLQLAVEFCGPNSRDFIVVPHAHCIVQVSVEMCVSSALSVSALDLYIVCP